MQRLDAGRAPKSSLQAKHTLAVRAGSSTFSNENPQNRRPGLVHEAITKDKGQGAHLKNRVLANPLRRCTPIDLGYQQIVTAKKACLSLLMMTAGQDRPGGFHLKFKSGSRLYLSTNPQILRVAFFNLREASRSASCLKRQPSALRLGRAAPNEWFRQGEQSEV